MAKDFLNKEIEVGNKVVFTELSYRKFQIGEIVRITNKMLFIEIEQKGGYKKRVKQSHNQVIKI